MSPGRSPWSWALLALLVVAAVLRFHNPAQHWLSHDEVHTALRTAGFPQEQIARLAVPSTTLKAGDLQRFLHLSPDHGWAATLRQLVRHPEHPPLYFLLARLVREASGDAMARVRQLSALFSLLTLPAMAWLGREASGQRGLAAVVAVTTAVSPLHLLYAQEARPYSLLLLLSALACAAYLRLRRLPGPRLFWGYVLSLLAGLYTSLIFLVVPLSHGLHALLAGRHRAQRRRWAGATALALLGFLPWLSVMGLRLHALLSHTAWLRTAAPPASGPLIRSLHWSAPFLDLGAPPPPWWPWLVLPVLLGLALAGAHHLARRGGGDWLLLVLLPAVNLLALESADLLSGGRHALTTRYLLPGLLGVQLLVAAAIWGLIASRSSRAVGGMVLLLCVLAGSVSCLSILRADSWWSRYAFHQPAELQRVLEACPGSVLRVVISPTSTGEAISLAQRLDGRTRVHFAARHATSPAVPVLHRSALGQVLMPSRDPAAVQEAS
ncbi:glycosyltransferase family 39 protein [Cyanobium sp. NIES-981]|uniref:glycosyltransferase family 39 protein n=1 Tax=Cyanobium sp. NIES-981 TaxID=1851505 RepID=UPI0007DCF5D4|nr:glycosyltransferase family 39 protein [Cyanobium sp. NIES-981]SBO42465.1 putative Dolichyl-phosphate-mannose-protein mannosyltransferase [Cyanobium sp. NIES-981]